MFQFLPIFFGLTQCLLDVVAFVVAIGLLDGGLEVDTVADCLKMGHYLRVVALLNAWTAGDYQC